MAYSTTAKLKYGKFRKEMEEFYDDTSLAADDRIVTGEFMNDSQILKAYSKYRHLRFRKSQLNRAVAAGRI